MQKSPLAVACGPVLGTAWLALWGIALHAVASPWEDLGGLVCERLRWLERFVLFSGLVVGYGLGGWVRQVRPPTSAHAYFRSLRLLVYPAGVLTAAGLVASRLSGATDATGVVFTGFLAYWAGADAAHGAIPLLNGRFLSVDDACDGGLRPDGER